MARELYIEELNTVHGIEEENTVIIGYNYKEKKYYITYKDKEEYITERTYAEDVLETIRAIVSKITRIYSPLLNIDIPNTERPTTPIAITPELLEELLSYIRRLSTTYETFIPDVTPIYYTWSDTGSYIASIQFSTYFEDSLILNAEKSKLYIYNSNVMFDLTLNENDDIRADYIREYYYNTVGIDLPFNFVGCLYNTLLSYYNPFKYNNSNRTISNWNGIPADKPFPYVVINADSTETENIEDIMYSNMYALANFTTKAPLEYMCAENPNNTTVTYELLNNIASLEGSIITLTNSPSEELHEGMTISLSHASTDIDGSTYSSDGNYTITEIDTENNTITVDDTFPYNYTYNPPILCIRGYEAQVSTVNRGTNEITLTNPVGNAYKVGDKIQLFETTITGSYGEQSTANGTYTISNIGVQADGTANNKVIIVEETPPINATTGKIYKDIKVGNIYKVVKTSSTTGQIYLENLTIDQQYLQFPANCVIIKVDEDRIRISASSMTSDNVITFTLGTGFTVVPEFTYTYAELNKPIYSEETQIEILNSTNEEKLPTGLFLVDTRQEVVNYIRLMTEAQQAVPTSESKKDYVEDDLGEKYYYSKVVPTFDNIGQPVINNTIYFYYGTESEQWHGKDVPRAIIMQFKGIYSKVYKEDN